GLDTLLTTRGRFVPDVVLDRIPTNVRGGESIALFLTELAELVARFIRCRRGASVGDRSHSCHADVVAGFGFGPDDLDLEIVDSCGVDGITRLSGAAFIPRGNDDVVEHDGVCPCSGNLAEWCGGIVGRSGHL